MKKFVSILLAVTLMMSITTIFCNASTLESKSNTEYSDTIQPRFVSIGSATLSITTSLMSATCYGDIDSQYYTYLAITLELQKQASDGSYSTVKTWNTSKNGDFLAFEDKANISPFSNYRVKGTFTADAEVHVMYNYPN